MARVAVSALILISAFSLKENPGFARDARCDRPPYGDTPEGYSIAQPGLKNIEKFLAEHPSLANEKMLSVIRKACEAKFDGGDRSSFYAIGMTDNDFETRPAEVLAMQYLGTKLALDDQKQREQLLKNNAESVAKEMNVFALFLCSAGSCSVYGESHITGPNTTEMVPYRTLSQCKQAAYRNSSGRSPGPDGRTMLDGGAWWECRGKHVEMWEPTR
jgi:hypothetical protein